MSNVHDSVFVRVRVHVQVLVWVPPVTNGMLVEGAAGQLQRGRHCYTILLSENAI
jgi:hypothetical protein